mgnify:FL=1
MIQKSHILQEEDERTPLKPIMVSTPLTFKHEFYLNGKIMEPEYYMDIFHTIRNAEENDVIIFYINSPGGNADTTIQFLSAIEDSPALFICSVEGRCFSASTLLFMKAQMFSIAPHSQFMFHNYSGGLSGKGGELKEQILHQTKWIETLLRDSYKYFFNEQEIQQILEGKDFWMDGDEVTKRMEYRIEQLSREQAQANSNNLSTEKKKKNSK